MKSARSLKGRASGLALDDLKIGESTEQDVRLQFHHASSLTAQLIEETVRCRVAYPTASLDVLNVLLGDQIRAP
ncbi:hypothetical protein IMZ11_31240 [Microtetraspora sp. AC03309]|uniref:hypothetical protein n=1 Tax=Microtetraspora sp. AC03309 TaxID=2779376 RepID=UPI001E56925A|nr:hypothetical protein [Microtetraspora sp. AC03309]MCC5580109.1 hypothetical protein [Microtetraspora sp. AC03309]